MKKLVYCATPARISYKKEEIMDEVTEEGHGPMHPFQAYPYERFEGGSIGREKTIEFCLRLINICDEFWMCGVSEGTMQELKHAIKIGKKIVLKLDEFDPEWKKYYKELGSKYGNPLDKLINK